MLTEELLKEDMIEKLTDDEILKLLTFIPSYDSEKLHPLGSSNLIELYFADILNDDEMSVLELLQSSDGDKIFKELSESFNELREVKRAMSDVELRTDDATWDKLDKVLHRYASTLQRYGKDIYHYGADLALRAVHPTAYYNKSWTLANLEERDWKALTDSLEELSLSIYGASVGNMEMSSSRSERAGIVLERLLRGNEISPLEWKWKDEEEKPREAQASLSEAGGGLIPNVFEPTGSRGTLQQMLPFFRYWSEKADAFVNSEKRVEITMHIAKFFEDMNVTMHDKSDTGELEDIIVRTLNRALGIAVSMSDG